MRAERRGELCVLIDVLRSILVFVLLAGAALGMLFFHNRLPERHRQDDTLHIVRLLANNFVVMSALVLGLLLTSARTSFDRVDRSVHAFATELLLFDHTLRTLGPEAAPARGLLTAYVQRALDRTWGASDGRVVVEDRGAEALLDRLGTGLRTLRPAEPSRLDDWRGAMQAYQRVVRQRWALVEESDSAVPRSLLRIVVAWLILIFASFGYRAPNNAVVITSFVAGAFLISAAVYMIFDLSVPFDGLIRISPEPMLSVLEHLRAG